MAASSGARSLEAAALVTEVAADGVADGAGPTAADVAAVRDLGGPGTPILVAGPDGAVRSTVSA